jgi:threonylcarbamoyladenosine tRNA methylthiotransferase MtaB
MPTAAVTNLGCKVNQYETEKIADSFVARGFDLIDFDSPADVYIINTCSVTAAADRKSRLMARRASRLSPGAKIVLTGCYAQLALDTNETVDCASLLVANREKMRVAELTLNAFPELVTYSGALSKLATEPANGTAVFPEEAGLIQLSSLLGKPEALRRTRATIKVQDGCQHFCAFCSIPYTRNTMASRKLQAVLDEARQLRDEGVQELVVTGVCVGAYGDGSSLLPDLIRALGEVDGIARVRLSSIQPIETSDDLIAAIAESPNAAAHLHLSLQSGDDSVLKAMQRPYDSAYFRDLVYRIRRRLPEIGLTTDVIVGFPGETDECFENSFAFCNEIQFARTHVFRYSPRQRTYADINFADSVPHDVKERRHKTLSGASRSNQSLFAGRYIGKTVDVLVEGRGMKDGWLAGYTGNYVRVHFPAGSQHRRSMLKVRIDEVNEEGEVIGHVDLDCVGANSI